MLFVLQCLFLANITWDFFLTVVVSSSHRALVFSGLSAGTTMFLIVPWIIGILVLATMLLVYMKKQEEGTNPLTIRVHFDYGLLMLLYVALIVFALINPAVAWPIVLNYLVNIVWAGALIYFRYRVMRLYF